MNNLFGNFGKLLEQAKVFQETMKTIRKVGEAGAGSVKVEMDGNHHIVSLFVDDEIYQEGKEVVLNLIIAAVNHAADEVKKGIKDKIAEVAGKAGLPANFNFPFL